MAKYGLPLERKFDISTEDKLRNSISEFNQCSRNKRLLLSRHLNEAIREYNILVDLSNDNEFSKYIDKRYLIKEKLTSDAPIFNKYVRSIVEVRYEDMAQYNKDVFDNLIQVLKPITDINIILDVIQYTNDYANITIKSKLSGLDNEEMVLTNLLYICDSLKSIVLYNGSLSQVHNLLSDIEVLLASGLDHNLIKRNILLINQKASNKITMCDNDVIRTVLKRTGDMLESNKPTQMALSKYKSLQYTSMNGNDRYVNYLLDKKSEYKSFLDIYMRDVVLGYSNTKDISNMYNTDEYALYEIKNNLDIYDEDVKILTKKYPKLTNVIATSELFRIRENLNKNNTMVIAHKNIAICILNKTAYFIMKKKNTDEFYLIDVEVILDLKHGLANSNDNRVNTRFNAIKIKFKDLQEDKNLESILESVSTVRPQLGRVKY